MPLYTISSLVAAVVLLGVVVGLTLAQRDESFLFPDQLLEKPHLAVNECFVPVSFTCPRRIRRVTRSLPLNIHPRVLGDVCRMCSVADHSVWLLELFMPTRSEAVCHFERVD